MIRMRLSEAAAALGVRVSGGDQEFAGCSTDTRSIRRGALFVALRGPNFNGHQFLQRARDGGAVAAMVDQKSDGVLPSIKVTDTRRGLGRLAGVWRERFTLPVVGVTGSNGKTTVKEMLAAILRRQGPTLATRGNLNNEIGVPLTLLRLGKRHRAAVVEMGASQPGEVGWLTQMAHPTVGVITQCSAAHLAGFQSIEGIARSKGELLENLDPGGTAVINADDPHAELWRRLAGERSCLSFGLRRPADVTANWRNTDDGIDVFFRTPSGQFDAHLDLLGRHNVVNAMAAVTVAVALGIPESAIIEGLARVRPVPGRLNLRPASGCKRLVDDSYNANPESLRAGLQVLARYPGRRWLVLGDMAELGIDAAMFHRRAGELARRYGIERLYAAGPLTRHAVETFGEGGRHFKNVRALLDVLSGQDAAEVSILVKGSRSMSMDKVSKALVGNAADPEPNQSRLGKSTEA